MHQIVLEEASSEAIPTSIANANTELIDNDTPIEENSTETDKDEHAEQEETTEEDRFFKFITMDGVNAPWVIDHFVNGVQSSRVNYESIQYNQKIPDSLFAKPATVKEIK